MKRAMITMLMALLVLVLAASAALAAPVLTDGQATAWIGENNYLYLQSPNGSIRLMQAAMDDMLSMSDTDLYCLTQDGRVFSVRKDGLSSAVLYSNPTDQELASLRETAYDLREGTLTLAGRTISTQAICAASNGEYLFYGERTNNGYYRLRQVAIPSAAASGSLQLITLPLDGVTISEPLSITVSKDALTLTGTDRTVTIYDLNGGGSQRFLATSWYTAAAALVNGKLYRYTEGLGGAWTLESAEEQSITWNAAPTAPVMSRVTATPVRATATPKPTATPVPAVSTEEDDTLYKGDSGSAVRSMQRRLTQLGYPAGAVDGSYGEETQYAVNLFYDAIGYREHNYVTGRVLDILYSKKAPAYDPYLPLTTGDRGVSVLKMQTRLQELGYSVEKLDGIYGDLTVKAVAQFQDEAAISMLFGETPGIRASSEFLEVLYSEYAPAHVVVTPVPQPEVPSAVQGGVRYTLDFDGYTATAASPENASATKLSIPSSIDVDGETFHVTKIAKNAFRNMTSLTTASIGKNVQSIGKNAFQGCANLESIRLKTELLTDKYVGDNAFDGIAPTAVIFCPAGLGEEYEELLHEKGVPYTVVFDEE